MYAQWVLVRFLAIIAVLLGATEIATAEDVPLPPTPGPTACELRLADLATFKPLPTLLGPGSCGASDVVRLETIVMRDKTLVVVRPAATLRCSIAESLALWIRNDIGP